jgi:outer membrane protein assembly factor BamB
MKGLPATWDYAKKENIRWIAALGSQSYGNPVVADGVVLVGTNNEGLRDPETTRRPRRAHGLRESDGEFLWQITDKLAAGRVNDWPYQGVCSSPLVENGVVYYVSNRSELIAADLKGMANGNDGVKDEKFTGPKDGDILWRYDMMEELGNGPHNMSNSSPVIVGDLVIISTSNGQDESHVNVPLPQNSRHHRRQQKDPANSSGKTTRSATRSSTASGRAPASGVIGGVNQAVIGQGDGWLRGYEAATGKKLWEFDMNPKDSVWPKTRNEVISTPIIVDGIIYIANGQDPEHGEGVGHLYAVDGTKRGDITKTGLLWHYDKIRRSISTGAYHDGLLYYADFSGFVHCVDAKTCATGPGSTTCSPPSGDPPLSSTESSTSAMKTGPRRPQRRTRKVLFETEHGSRPISTPTPANGSIYVVNRNQLIAIGKK